VGKLDVFPLDDDELVEQAPVTPDGKVKVDPAKLEARHDGQVKAAIDHGHISLLILGGSPDLSEAVRPVRGGSVEYVRVTTTQYKEIADENK
jgi:hypothetical protein